MVLRLKTRKSRSLPGLRKTEHAPGPDPRDKPFITLQLQNPLTRNGSGFYVCLDGDNISGYTASTMALARFKFGRFLSQILIAVAMLFAPIQPVTIAQASAPVSMSDMLCQEPQACCDKDKADCGEAQGCMAIGGGVATLAAPDAKVGVAYSEMCRCSFTQVVLSPHMTEPLRKPPRI
jgi:hypothetical protein